YFPKVKNQLELQKNRVQLYSNQVFITDQLEGVIPEFMMLLHGVIDSPDIPLNVSRSFLQSDAHVKKISTHITKKVADKLEEMFKENREEFEKIWDDIKVFVQYGCITDEKFYDRAKAFYLFKNTKNQYFTIDEYAAKIALLQKDKNENLIYLYASDAKMQTVYINAAQERGYDVLLFDGFLDVHFINMLESKLEKSKFTRVDADVVDKLIEKEDFQPSKLTQKEEDQVKELFTKNINAEKFVIQLEPLSETDLPVMITRNEFMRRFQDMEKLSGQKGMYGSFENYNLIVNSNHAVVDKILKLETEEQKEEVVKQLIDIALLSQNLLEGEALSNFVNRTIALL
ncbi:MAG: molecular chaperone HtpG, partial [Bacteroidales bacterium]|nr:molecular chaperone HtpG [Bacteroidales bacterium]